MVPDNTRNTKDYIDYHNVRWHWINQARIDADATGCVNAYRHALRRTEQKLNRESVGWQVFEDRHGGEVVVRHWRI